MHTLDLHGVRHYDVEHKVENFVLMNQYDIPLTIICGNSQKMIDLVNNTLQQIECEEVIMDQYGIIVIRSI